MAYEGQQLGQNAAIGKPLETFTSRANCELNNLEGSLSTLLGELRHFTDEKLGELPETRGNAATEPFAVPLSGEMGALLVTMHRVNSLAQLALSITSRLQQI